MLLVDTSVLINAHRPEANRHEEYLAWLQEMINGPQPYAVSDFAIAGMIRIVTNPRIFADPTPTEIALDFAERVRGQPHAIVVAPSARFWGIFTELCREADVRGDLVPDAYLAALAIENACEFVTDDKGFRRFPGLRWRQPLN
jgi:toxin-antitoxin system PIN domain toxin